MVVVGSQPTDPLVSPETEREGGECCESNRLTHAHLSSSLRCVLNLFLSLQIEHEVPHLLPQLLHLLYTQHTSHT